MQTKEFNQLQQRLLKELQNCHRNNVKVGQKDKDFLRMNNKGVENVNICNLTESQIKSLQCLQSHVGRGNLVLEAKFSRCHAEMMYKQSQANLYATFGGKNAVPEPQNVRFPQKPSHANPKIAKNDLPNALSKQIIKGEMRQPF